jgi:hypothetical protein
MMSLFERMEGKSYSEMEQLEEEFIRACVD